jgi:hypothetical protein
MGIREKNWVANRDCLDLDDVDADYPGKQNGWATNCELPRGTLLPSIISLAITV